MNPALKTLYVTGYVFYVIFLVIFTVLVGVVVAFLLLLHSSVHTVLFSPNWSMRPKHAPAVETYLGRPIEHVRRDSLDWLLHHGALLLPDEETRGAVRRLSAFAPKWSGFRKDSDLEQGLGES